MDKKLVEEFTNELEKICEIFGKDLQFRDSDDFKSDFKSDDFTIEL